MGSEQVLSCVSEGEKRMRHHKIIVSRELPKRPPSERKKIHTTFCLTTGLPEELFDTLVPSS